MRVLELEGETALALPSGDPAEIRAASARFRRVAERGLATTAVTGRTAGELRAAWSGAAADLAAAELATLAGRAHSVLPQLGEAATALSGYADVLEEAAARIRSLRARASEARDQHARLVASAQHSGADPLTVAAATARADELLSQDLLRIHRAHDRAGDELHAAATRCARTLSGLASTGPVGTGGAGAVHEALLGLPLTRAEIERASQAAAGTWTPPEPRTWWESAIEAAGDGAAWAYNHAAVPLVNGAANVVEAVVEHPEDLLEMALGAGMIIVGTGGEFAGVALDVTGVGAVAGVPLNVAAAAAIAAGAGAVTHGASRLANHAAQNENHLLKEVDGPSVGGRGQPGDPLPDSLRPELAGSNWQGRVAKNGKGEVWQDPDMISTRGGLSKDRNEIRFMDPDQRYPQGYVVFYNKEGQPMRSDGRTGTRDETHLPIRPDGTFDVPLGWNP
jgi:hypothetical protein